MSNISIRVEGLSKQYHIGGKQEGYKALRDTLTDAFKAPFRRAGKLLRGQAYGAAGLDETIWALKDVSFEIKHGEVVGIIGGNGAGKSTLLKILSRITEPTKGYAEIHGRVGSLIEVGTGFHPELTGRENIYLNGAILGMKRTQIERRFDEIVAFAEVEKFLDTPTKHFSSGMYLRLAFAVAAHLEPEILLVDEVLAVGDASFQKKCLGKMDDVAKEGRTVLFVSHNMGAIRNLCSRALLINEGQIQLSGKTEDVVQKYLGSLFGEQANHTVLAERRDRSGSGSVRVVSFQAKASDSQGGPPKVGIPAKFIVGYAARQECPISRLFVAIGVSDDLGTSVFGCSTAMVNAEFCNLQPRGQIVCQIDDLPLVPGRYNVKIKLIDDHGHADNITEAASFDIIDGGDSGVTGYQSRQWGGSVVLRHKWFLDSYADQNK